jgi:hypothetical protein
VNSLNRARDAIDLVAATVDAVAFVEHSSVKISSMAARRRAGLFSPKMS